MNDKMRPCPKVRTCLWFDGDADTAAELYVSLLPNSAIGAVVRPDPSGPPLVVEFVLAGTPYMLLNGGPAHKLSPAASIAVRTADQHETDRLWQALIAGGGEEGMCGWLTDRFGVSWQIIPEELVRMMSADDRDAAQRATVAMMKMTRIEIAGIRRAFDGT